MQISTDPMWNIATLLQTRTGLHFGSDRRDLLERQARALCSEFRISSLDELYILLGSHSTYGRAALGRLIERVTVNHTKFFREPHSLRKMCRDAAGRYERDCEVRVWSAAAASGEELYSVVMLLAEEIGLPAVRLRWKFLGSDISQEMVAEAERGVYPASRVATVPEHLLEKYFDQQPGGGYRVRREIRELCMFRRFNLLSQSYPFRQGFHLILCRNVLYYFDESARCRVLRSLYGATTEGGLLVTSLSESIASLPTEWARVSPCLHIKESARATG